MERSVKFHAIYERHGNWYVGYVQEIPGVNAQERTLKEARKSLTAALQELAHLYPDAIAGNKRRYEEVEVVVSG